MRKALIAVAAFILIFTHVIPPSNYIFATEEMNECEQMAFTVKNIKETDLTINGTAGPSQNIEIEFKTKNKRELVSADDNGEFSLDIEEGLLKSNDVIAISNDYFIIETVVKPTESEDTLIQSTQYVECRVMEETEVVDIEGNADEISEEDISGDESVDSESIAEENPDELNNLDVEVENIELFTTSFTEADTSNLPNIESIYNPDSLTEVQILNNTVIGANLSESENPDYYNLNLNLIGTGIADVELISPDRTVIFYSSDLARELVHNNGAASVRVEILPLNLEDDLPELYNALGAVTSSLNGLVNKLVSAIEDILNNPITGPLLNVQGLTELTDSLGVLNNLDDSLQELGAYNGEVEYLVNEDGLIIVNFSDGIGQHLETVTQDVVVASLNRVGTAIGNVRVGGVGGILLNPVVRPTLRLLEGLVNESIDPLISQILDETTGLLDGLASAQVIGETNVNLNVLVNKPPGNVRGAVPIIGAGIQATTIDVNLLNDAEGRTEIFFPDITAPTLNSAIIEGNSRNGYIVSGSEATEPDDIVNVINSEGNIVATGHIDINGNFSIELTELVNPDEVLIVQAVDEAGNESNTLQVTVPLDVTRIESVPDIVFNTTSITNEETLVLRQSENNSVQIMDTRREGNWELSAGANSLSNNNGDELSNALVYIKRNGEEVHLGNEAVAVASSDDASSSELIDTITWSDNEGMLLRLNPIFAQAGTTYNSTITWTLNDVPQY